MKRYTITAMLSIPTLILYLTGWSPLLLWFISYSLMFWILNIFFIFIIEILKQNIDVEEEQYYEIYNNRW